MTNSNDLWYGDLRIDSPSTEIDIIYNSAKPGLRRNYQKYSLKEI